MNGLRGTVILLLCFEMLFCGSAALLLYQTLRSEHTTSRLRSVHARVRWRVARRMNPAEGLLRMLAHLGAALIRLHAIPGSMVKEAETLISGANLRIDSAVATVLGGKVLLLVVSLPSAYLLAGLQQTVHPLFLAVGAAAASLMLPDMWLSRRRKLRIRAIELGLPDALDLLVICADAGLGLDQSLERVTHEIANVHPEVAAEFAITANRVRLAPDQRVVLMEISERLNIEFLRRLFSTLAQSIQLGVPLSKSLRSLSQELRKDQMADFEAKAGMLPVMLTLPMVVFIMPTVLIVVGGPAAIEILRGL